MQAASRYGEGEKSLGILKLDITWKEMARIYYNTGFREETNRNAETIFSLENQVKKDEDQQTERGSKSRKEQRQVRS